MGEDIPTTDEQWRQRLTPQEYKIMRQGGTEPAFTGVYWDNKADGVYRCKACGTPLFDAETKYDSGTGWPSFFKPIDDEVIDYTEDVSHGMRRVEAKCARCGSHLGHVFPDGPQPTGQRYCMNSAALDLDEAGQRSDEPAG